MAVRVLICDDHAMVRESLAIVLNGEEDIIVTATTSSVKDTISTLEHDSSNVDVAVVDIRLGDGTGHDITQWIKSHHPHINVVLLTSFLDDDVLVGGYTSRASAIVLKGSPTGDLVAAIRDVAAGLQLINPTQARAASKRVNSLPMNVLASLNETDRDIAVLISKGMTDRDIAASLHFSLQTVKNRVSRILTQIGVANRTQLAVFIATNHDPKGDIP